MMWSSLEIHPQIISKYSIACAPCWILEDSWPQFTWSVTNGHFEHFNWKRTSNHPENKALRILKRNPSNIQLHASKSSFQNGRIQIAGKPPEVGSANPTTCREKIVARRFSRGGHKKRVGVRTTGDTLKYIRSFAQRFELLMVWQKTWKYMEISILQERIHGHTDLHLTWHQYAPVRKATSQLATYALTIFIMFLPYTDYYINDH